MQDPTLMGGGESSRINRAVVREARAALAAGDERDRRLVRRRAGTDVTGRLVPTGWANLFEAVCQYLRKEVAEPVLPVHELRAGQKASGACARAYGRGGVHFRR